MTWMVSLFLIAGIILLITLIYFQFQMSLSWKTFKYNLFKIADRSMFLYHLNSLKVSQNHEIIYINRMTNSHFPGSNQACYKLENLNY